MEIRLAENIRNFRKERALTQEQLSEKLGVNSRTVSRWENANTMPDFDLMIEYSDVTPTDVQMLTRECHKWFILDGKLPPLEEWTSKIYVYHVSVNTRRNVQQETASMLRGFIA